MVYKLQNLIAVGLILSSFYVLYYVKSQITFSDSFEKSIVEIPQPKSKNEDLLKNDNVQNLANMAKGAIKEEYKDSEMRGNNSQEKTNAKMFIEKSRPQVSPEEKKKTDDKKILGNRYLKLDMVTDTEADLSPRERAKIVQERCKRLLKENKIEHNHRVRSNTTSRTYMSSRRYNITLCINPRVASTNIRRILYALDHNLTGDVNLISTSEARSYGKKRLNSFQQVLANKDHVSIMFVREPMERLLSSYRRKNMSITFKEFLQQILDTKTEKLNKHMFPYYENCHPCEKEYDFIVSQLFFQENIKDVLRRSNLLEKVGIPDRAKTGYIEDSEKVLLSYYKGIPNDMLHKLWEKYKKDYNIFGYPYPSHLMNKTS